MNLNNPLTRPATAVALSLSMLFAGAGCNTIERFNENRALRAQVNDSFYVPADGVRWANFKAYFKEADGSQQRITWYDRDMHGYISFEDGDVPGELKVNILKNSTRKSRRWELFVAGQEALDLLDHFHHEGRLHPEDEQYQNAIEYIGPVSMQPDWVNHYRPVREP